jgi:hypothetical protein
MNALTRTAHGLSLALSGRKRAAQAVVVVSRSYRAGWCRTRVLVVPEGAEQGEYYDIHTEAMLQRLRDGMTPAELELEPVEDEDETEDDAPGQDSPESLRRWYHGKVL